MMSYAKLDVRTEEAVGLVKEGVGGEERLLNLRRGEGRDQPEVGVDGVVTVDGVGECGHAHRRRRVARTAGQALPELHVRTTSGIKATRRQL